MNEIKTQAAPELRIPSDTLHAYVRAIWEHAGSTPREAELVADHLVMANLSGHDSHGVGMIPRYVASLADGELKLNAHAEIVRDAGAVLTIDGVKGFGQVVAYEAMEHGIERAKKLGVCAVGLRDAHHIGRIGHWAEQCAKAGLVSFHFVNVAGDPLVAPFGGTDRRFGTNPFCAAFPREGKTPLVLDFATSGIAYGKTRVAYNKGVKVAPGYLIEHDGTPTVEPKVMHEEPFGSLLPFGLHKGFGLAAMCEILRRRAVGRLHDARKHAAEDERDHQLHDLGDPRSERLRRARRAGRGRGVRRVGEGVAAGGGRRAHLCAGRAGRRAA